MDMVLSTHQGRRFMWRLLEKTGMFDVGFHGESTHNTSFAAGMRNFGLSTWSDITQNHNDAAKKMILENMEESDVRERGAVDSLDDTGAVTADDGAEE